MEEYAHQEEPTGKIYRFKRFIRECIRVLKVTKKPDKFEFKSIVKASALGMAIIGGIGFIIHMINALIFS